MCEGVFLSVPALLPQLLQSYPSTVLPSQNPTSAHPIIWRVHFPLDVVKDLVYWGKPQGIITNSKLELVGSLIHHDFVGKVLTSNIAKPSLVWITWRECGGNIRDHPRASPHLHMWSSYKPSTSATIVKSLATILPEASITSFQISPPGQYNYLSINCCPILIHTTHRIFHGAWRGQHAPWKILWVICINIGQQLIAR